jgi:transcriptional regulator with XRE-family HTH domain
MELDYKKIGIRIKHERLKQNISQEKLAEFINMSKEHVSHIECGTTKLSLPALVKICNSLEITPDLLLLDSLYKSSEYLKDEFSKIIENCNNLDLKLIIETAKAIISVNKD